MNENNKEVGVITEQGFVAGMGLGHTAQVDLILEIAVDF